jgi:MFS family permease
LSEQEKLPLLELVRARPAFRSFIAIRTANEVSAQMVNVAIGWYVYAATHNPMSLAWVGLAQFLPNMSVTLIAGHVADRFNRRNVIVVSLLVQTVCLAAFVAVTSAKVPSARPVYLLLLVLGAARSFYYPTMSVMVPHLVNGKEFPRAVAASSSIFQVCSIAGPAIGGVIYAISGSGMFALATVLSLYAALQARRLPSGRSEPGDDESELDDKHILAGIRYVWANRVLLALISLDLFAVLLGGVTALMPIYAKDILKVGPAGLGWLRCAPGVGAAMVGIVLAHRTIESGVGRKMLACVAGFGVATAVFAVSKNFWLSLAAMCVAGGFDMVSMVIRQTMVQISTPDKMRGRVSAVNWVFIGASSELGEFESGVTAAIFGTVPAALIGGLGTLVVVGLWSWIFPELPRTDKMVGIEESVASG